MATPDPSLPSSADMLLESGAIADPASEALAHFLSAADLHVVTGAEPLRRWVRQRRAHLVPPERMLAQLKRLLAERVNPGPDSDGAVELRRIVVHAAIKLYYSEP